MTASASSSRDLNLDKLVFGNVMGRVREYFSRGYFWVSRGDGKELPNGNKYVNVLAFEPLPFLGVYFFKPIVVTYFTKSYSADGSGNTLHSGLETEKFRTRKGFNNFVQRNQITLTNRAEIKALVQR